MNSRMKLNGPSGDSRKRSGLGQEMYNRLREAIISGELAPDEPMSEVALAERFKVSRTPVRETLARLANDGLVRNTPNRGSRVAGISLTDVGELFQMREVLEGLATRLAAQNRRADLLDLDELMADFLPYINPSPLPSFSEYHRLTARLDDALVARAGNKRLENALRDVWAHSRRLRQYASHDVQRMSASAAEHLAILEAVRDGDADLAEKRLCTHLDNSRNAVLTKLMGQHS